MNPEVWQAIAIAAVVLLLLTAGGIGADGLLRKRLREAWQERDREVELRERLRQRLGWGDGTETESDCEDCG